MPGYDDYNGREQSLVKHYILKHYVERLAHIIGHSRSTLNYIDCFSGPWSSNAPDLSDTSFSIALEELRKARDTHRDRRRSFAIRCMFLERTREAFMRLQQFAILQTDVHAVALNKEMLAAIPDMQEFIREGGPDSFSFLFIDPTGWTGFDLDQIQPLLRIQPGEVLINFMTSHVRRLIDDQRPEIQDSIRRCFGTEEVFSRMRQLYGDDFRERQSQDVEDELFTFYAQRVREVGGYTYTCPAIVLHPQVERTYFHLIYATRHRRGVEVFKEVEKSAFDFQEDVRREAQEQADRRKTGMGSLFAEIDQPPSRRAIALRERYLAMANDAMSHRCAGRQHIPFDDLWDTAMSFPLVWDSDVKAWVAEAVRTSRIRIRNLKPRQRTPQVGENILIDVLR